MKLFFISMLVLILLGCNGNAVSTNPIIEVDEVKNIEEEFVEVFQKERIPYINLTHHIEYQLFEETMKLEKYPYQEEQLFDNEYSSLEGVLTYRGNHYRNGASFGYIHPLENKLEVDWSTQTGSSPKWGGGAGWTGQPSIIKWHPEVQKIMNLYDEYKEKVNFVEVVYGSLDGNVYFLDLDTGQPSRPAINIQNPIKGSVAIDPRGYPLLYVGQGIQQVGAMGYRIFSLIDGELLFFIHGSDPVAYRKWAAFDGAVIVNRETDTMFVGGENGILYKVNLHTDFNPEQGTISIDPVTFKYRYRIEGNAHFGIENSVAAYKNLLFFADNGGSVQAIDTSNMQPRWSHLATDDTDSTIVIEEVNHSPFLYTGTEVDHVRRNGEALIRKINGLTGEEIWRREVFAHFFDGVNGGVLATPILGRYEIDDLIIFTVARTNSINSGTMYAFYKENGETAWKWDMPNYAWSSGVDVYSEEGIAYILQADSIGNLFLLNGSDGELLDRINLGSNIEASPAVFNDTLVVATRGGQIYGVKIK